uniref:sigma-54-dependent transcriptional regulator n=1 Tax=Alicyclobacillus shizuokensis TaxID=392014 RepID=UPI0008350D4D
MKTLLLIDDEVKLTKILGSMLSKRGYPVVMASNGQEARHALQHVDIDIILLDMMLPDTSGLELLSECKGLYPDKLIIVVTAFGNIENAVQAMKLGAFDYITKPVKFEELEIVLRKASDWIDLKKENSELRTKVHKSLVNQLPSVNPKMKSVCELVGRVAKTDATVLLQGESGTGKSMIARLIHDESDRRDKPFIYVNCAAIPANLLESELFGFEKGAFTGATQSKAGKFEAANGGSIFLDEIAELPLPLQSKLLQVTQDKTFTRIGSNQKRSVDVRIITATNKSLKEMVQLREFREDLYYRLNVVTISIPPLRERKDDIPVLIEHFLHRHRVKRNRNYIISPQIVNVLLQP